MPALRVTAAAENCCHSGSVQALSEGRRCPGQVSAKRQIQGMYQKTPSSGRRQYLCLPGPQFNGEDGTRTNRPPREIPALPLSLLAPEAHERLSDRAGAQLCRKQKSWSARKAWGLCCSLKMGQRKRLLFAEKRENKILSLWTKVQFSAIGIVRDLMCPWTL